MIPPEVKKEFEKSLDGYMEKWSADLRRHVEEFEEEEVEKGGPGSGRYPAGSGEKGKEGKEQIRRGEIVRFKPEWSSPADEGITFRAAEDELPDGKIRVISDVGMGALNPVATVKSHMLERVEKAKLHVIHFGTNEDLPDSVRNQIGDPVGQELFRAALNQHLSGGGTEMNAYVKAYRSLKDAGYAYDEMEKCWTVQKEAPASADVHVDRPIRSTGIPKQDDEDEDGDDAGTQFIDADEDGEIEKVEGTKARKDGALYVYEPEAEGRYQCDQCPHFIPGEEAQCYLFGPDDVIQPYGTCSYWVFGDPSEDQEPSEYVTPEEAGYVESERGFSCARCEYFGAAKEDCLVVDKDSPGDTPGKIVAGACCGNWEDDDDDEVVSEVEGEEGDPAVKKAAGDPGDLDKADTEADPLSSEAIEKVIRQDGNSWSVYSEDGAKRLGGPYKTKQEAVERLRQIEHFKHVEKGGPGSGRYPAGSGTANAIGFEDISTAHIGGGMLRSIQQDLADGVTQKELRSNARADNALSIIQMMTTDQTMASGMGVVPIQNIVAKGPDGKVLGVMQGFHSLYDKSFKVDLLGVNPQILLGKIQAKGVGTRLMVEAAKVAAKDGVGLSLTSLDKESDKFYTAIGMTKMSLSEFKWSPEQAKAMAEKVSKAEKFDAQAALEAALAVEEEVGPPLACRKPKDDEEGEKEITQKVYLPPIEVHQAARNAFDHGMSVIDITAPLAEHEGLSEENVRKIGVWFASIESLTASPLTREAWGGKDAAAWVTRVIRKAEKERHYEPWIGVDFHNTLVDSSEEEIGDPNQEMIDRVKGWLDDGKTVKIVTASVADDPEGETERKIQAWSKIHFGRILPVTNEKDPGMTDLWDDKAHGPDEINKADLEEDSDFEIEGDIIKVDKAKHLVFGWFSIITIQKRSVVDTQGDIIDPETLEGSAYHFVLNARTGGEMHDSKDGEVRGVAKLVESVVFTDEKQKAMVDSLKAQGIDATLDLGCIAWWGGFFVEDDKAWEKITTGHLKGFSIGGKGKRAALIEEEIGKGGPGSGRYPAGSGAHPQAAGGGGQPADGTWRPGQSGVAARAAFAGVKARGGGLKTANREYYRARGAFRRERPPEFRVAPPPKAPKAAEGTQQPDKSHIEEGLRNSPPASIDYHGGGCSQSFQLKLENGEKGLWKPGTDWPSDPKAEAAVYETAKIVGMTDMVPVTVTRTLPGVMRDKGKAELRGAPIEGSLMRWAEGNVRNAGDYHKSEVKYDGDKDLSRMAVFDYVIGNTDRHDNNWMVEKNTGKITLVDHGLTFNETDRGIQAAAYAGQELYNRIDKGTFKEDLGKISAKYIASKDKIMKTLRDTGIPEHKVRATGQRIDKLAQAKGDWKKLRSRGYY